MEKEVIEKLLKIVPLDTERAALTVMYNAWCGSFIAYKDAMTKSNLSEWQAAEKALKSKVEELQTKYEEFEKENRLPDRNAAVRFLQGLGYKIKKSKLYNDAAKRLFRINPDGSIDESVVRAYAERFLSRVRSAESDEGALDKIHMDKAIAETRRAQLQADKLQFDMDRDRGSYLRREEVITQFAVKWSLIEATVKHVLQSKAIEIIQAVGGDPKKKNLFTDMCFAEIDDRLNQLATIEDLKISLLATEDSEKDPA